MKEVTRGMIEAIRPQKVDYNESDMAEQDGIIILNHRHFKQGESQIQREAGSRHERNSDSIVRSL